MKTTKYLHGNLTAVLPFISLLIMLLITYQAFNITKIELEEKTKTYFNFRVNEVTRLIKERVSVYELVLHGARGLFLASNSIVRDEFNQYVTALDLANNYPGIQGVGFSLVVPPAQKKQHVTSIRSEGFPEFTIWPEGQRDIYSSIIYLEPFDYHNQRAFGYDMFSEPIQRSAMQQAIDTGQAQLSGKIKPIKEAGQQDQSEFFMYLPVFDKGTNTDTLSQRREHILGWVYSPFRMNDFMEGLFGQQAGDLSIQIFDEESMSNEGLMYDSDDGGHATNAELEATVKIEVAGRQWIIHIHPLAAMSSHINAARPYPVAAIGITLSILISSLIWFQMTGRKRVEQALLKNKSLLRTLVNSTPDLIWIKDTDGVYLFCNSAFEHFFGAKEADIKGKTDYNFVAKEQADLFRKNDKNVILTHSTTVYEEALSYADGSYQGLFETIKIPMLSEEGNTISVLGVARDITKRKALETTLIEKEERLWRSLAASKQSWFDLNLQTGEMLVSLNYPEMLGYVPAEFDTSLQNWKDNLHPDDYDAVMTTFREVLRSDSAMCMEYRRRKKDGSWLWFKTSAEVFERGLQEQPLRVRGLHAEITDRKLEENKLRLAASVFTHAQEGIIITDAEAAIIEVNGAFSEVTGYLREELIGKNPRILKSERQSPEFYADMWQALLKKGRWYGEVWNRRKNGEVYAEMKTISAVYDESGVTTHYVALSTDITQKKEYQDQLERSAHYDLLTNLPNRVLLSDRLNQAMLHCQRQDQSLAVVFLDLDGFKEVNDSHGHDVGDELLIALSARMKEALREGDTLARLGGDEFVAVLTDLTQVEDCEPVLERLLLAASVPITIGEVILTISASIGVTLYPQDNVDADLLMRHADQAMYAAKESGKNHYHLFDTAQDDAVKAQRENLEAIRTALDNHQFELYYQPKVNMRTGEVIGVEALIRWQHPERGLLSPIEFLPVIENHIMMIEMGEWVIDAALSQIIQWQTIGLNFPLHISVNIAAVQLQKPDFINRLTTLLAAYPDVDSYNLELEVLETSALEDVETVSATMKACMAALGVKFALDDFGTGYSSLTYLRRLPASLIKIDQTFVRDMLVDPEDLAIVEGVIGLAKSFKRDVIAEGVETVEHGTALLKLGCELAQGYGIAKPMPASDILKWLNEWKPDDAWKV